MGNVDGSPPHIEGIGFPRLIAFNRDGPFTKDIGVNVDDLLPHLIRAYLIGPGELDGGEGARMPIPTRKRIVMMANMAFLFVILPIVRLPSFT